jgi:hypothetical protein
MDRKNKPQVGKGAEWQTHTNRRIILDNGAANVKCSLASDSKPHIALNAVGRHKKT